MLLHKFNGHKHFNRFAFAYLCSASCTFVRDSATTALPTWSCGASRKNDRLMMSKHYYNSCSTASVGSHAWDRTGLGDSRNDPRNIGV